MNRLAEKEKIVTMGLIHIVDNDRDIKTIFNKKVYEDEFLKFYRIYFQGLTAYNELYESSENPEKYVKEVALKIMDHEMSKINAIEKKRVREMKMMEDSAFAALFVIPAIDRYGHPGTDALADALIEEWHKNFPKNQIQKGHFDEINSGFKKRRFCYITTAVCGSMGKSDDCYELTILRNYRDGWLMKQPDGEALIHQYYGMAPSIIAMIDSCKAKKEIYHKIYHKYLLPCIHLIEDGKFDACKAAYIQMMDNLNQEFSN